MEKILTLSTILKKKPYKNVWPLFCCPLLKTHTKVTPEKTIKNSANLLFILFFTAIILYFLKVIFIPLTFGFIIAILLKPLCAWLEKHGMSRLLSILTTFFSILMILSVAALLFGQRILSIFSEIQNFGNKISELFNETLSLAERYIPIEQFREMNLNDPLLKSLVGENGLLGNAFSSLTTLLTYLLFIFLFSFFMLLYRHAFRHFFLSHFSNQKKGFIILKEVQQVVQGYFYGLIIIITILSILNSTGLWLLQIDFPLFFGISSALLTIIPYLGTTIGAVIPILYALINYDGIWKAIFVLILYISVQALEGNILTPNIVGPKASINPLFALLAIVTGGVFWGIPGMILFLPMLAIIKVFMEHSKHLQPYSRLLSSHIREI